MPALTFGTLAAPGARRPPQAPQARLPQPARGAHGGAAVVRVARLGRGRCGGALAGPGGMGAQAAGRALGGSRINAVEGEVVGMGEDEDEGEGEEKEGNITETDTEVMIKSPQKKEALQAVSPDGVSLSRKGYHSIPLGDCEFLVAKDSQGQYDLRDVYLLDNDSGIYARPETAGEMPTDAATYQEIPWISVTDGDPWKGKTGSSSCSRVYLVKWHSLSPVRRIDPREVYMCDANSRLLERCHVEGADRLAVEDFDKVALAIRGNEVVLSDATGPLANPEVICNMAFDERMAKLRNMPVDIRSLEEEIEVLGSTFDLPDVPEVDLM